MSFLSVGWLYFLPLFIGLLFYLRRHGQQERHDRARFEKAKQSGISEPLTLHPVIDTNKCIGSGACVKACPEHALGLVRGKAVMVQPDHCIGHGACETACPVEAISLVFGTEKRGVPKPDESAKTKETVKLQALIETKAKVPPTYLLGRGSLQNKGPEVAPAVPAVLASAPVKFPEPEPDAKSSGRRRVLAEWIASPSNPLTWRVLANRIWQHHFGRGLVGTPSNFGFKGERPTHPELLDFLASQLIADGGRWKPLHRLLLTSATYRQAAGAEKYLVISIKYQDKKIDF